MTLYEMKKAWRIIQAVAAMEGITNEEACLEIKKTIDAGWEASQNDPVAKARWLELFPDGRIPTVEEFIVSMASHQASKGNVSSGR